MHIGPINNAERNLLSVIGIAFLVTVWYLNQLALPAPPKVVLTLFWGCSGLAFLGAAVSVKGEVWTPPFGRRIALRWHRHQLEIAEKLRLKYEKEVSERAEIIRNLEA